MRSFDLDEHIKPDEGCQYKTAAATLLLMHYSSAVKMIVKDHFYLMAH